MTWPIIAIGWLDLDEPTLAATHLRRSYQPYLRPPFNVWNERPAGFGGASNFVTGAGGFLQAILNGYAGIRLQDSELTLKPRLPPGTTRLFIPRIHYMQSVFSLEILPDKFTISTDLANLTPLELLVDNQGYEMCSFCVVSGVHNATLRFRRGVLNGCELRPTTLNMRLADQNGGATNRVSLILVAILAVKYLMKIAFE